MRLAQAKLAELERNAEQARQGVTGEWTWDDGTLIELDHEDPVGIQVTQARGTPVAPHISTADPATVLALVADHRELSRIAGWAANEPCRCEQLRAQRPTLAEQGVKCATCRAREVVRLEPE